MKKPIKKNKQKPTGMSSLEPSKKSSGLPSLEPHYFSSIPSLISSVVPHCIEYYENKYDVYNDYKCDDVGCWNVFITSSSYVWDLIGRIVLLVQYMFALSVASA